jgi:hypothetical protein
MSKRDRMSDEEFAAHSRFLLALIDPLVRSSEGHRIFGKDWANVRQELIDG